MNILSNFISSKFPIIIIIVALGTYFSPYYWKVSSVVPSILLGMVIFFTGLSMNLKVIKEIRYKKKELLIATLLKWTITVLISIGLAMLFLAGHDEIAAGFVLTGAVPSATAATVYAFLAGGNTSIVIAASLFDIAISPILTPIALMGISTAKISISFWNLLQSFLLIVMIPISLGVVLQIVTPKISNHSKMLTKLGSPFSLLLVLHIILGSGKEALNSELKILPYVAVATVIQVLVPMLLSYYICKKLKISEEDARASMFHVGLCNSALAAILALHFIGELGVIAPIFNLLCTLSFGALLSNYFSNKDNLQGKVERQSSF